MENIQNVNINWMNKQSVHVMRHSRAHHITWTSQVKSSQIKSNHPNTAPKSLDATCREKKVWKKNRRWFHQVLSYHMNKSTKKYQRNPTRMPTTLTATWHVDQGHNYNITKKTMVIAMQWWRPQTTPNNGNNSNNEIKKAICHTHCQTKKTRWTRIHPTTTAPNNGCGNGIKKNNVNGNNTYNQMTSGPRSISKQLQHKKKQWR